MPVISQKYIAARAAYDANCKLIGDPDPTPWSLLGDQAYGYLKAVDSLGENLDRTLEDQHEAWRAARLGDGWMYGTMKDTVNKTHPNLVAYSELPKEQKFKDQLFRTVVCSVMDWDFA
jgi:hypothetical protein